MGPLLRYFDKVNEVLLTLFEASSDGFLRVLGEELVLYDKVVKVISEVVSACGSTMAVEHPKEADLGPNSIVVRLALGL